MKKIDIKKSITELQKIKTLTIKQFPEFSFGDKQFCEQLIKSAMLEVDKTITEFDFLPEYDEIADYLSNTKGKGLFLTGSVGRGKSIIVEKVIPALFYSKNDKIISVYHSFELGKKMNEAKDKKFIAIDDVGTESLHNDFGNKSEAFADLIVYAERNANIVFITTNLSSQQIIKRYGERTIDRIRKLCRIVKFEGESLRK